MKYQVKYAGPKTFINQHGIFFEDGKEDKYKFLIVALQILRSLDETQKNLHKNKLTPLEILQFLEKYEPDLENKIKEEEIRYEKEFENKLKIIQSYNHLSNIEKQTWIKNEIIMKDYIFQRNINKIYYHHCINDIKKIIKSKHIKELELPFSEEDWHILQSIQNELENLKEPIYTIISIAKENEQLYIKLKINY